MRRFCYSLLLLITFIPFAMSQSSREFKKTIPLATDGLLVIDTYKGSITIATHDKPEVDLEVRIEADGDDSRQAEQDVRDTEIDIREHAAEVSIHTDYGQLDRHRHNDFWDWLFNFGDSWSSLPLVHYTITMPRTARLEIKDYKSETHIDGLKSTIHFKTYKGTVEIADLEGGIALETYKGSARVAIDRLSDDCRFQTYKGEIKVRVPKKSGFDLRTDFGKRVDFYSEFGGEPEEHGKKKHRTSHQDKINGGGPSLEFESEKGNIRLQTN
jgi:hypothetical protein